MGFEQHGAMPALSRAEEGERRKDRGRWRWAPQQRSAYWVGSNAQGLLANYQLSDTRRLM